MSRTAREWEQTPPLPKDHYVNSLIYSDKGIFREEKQKILRRSWTFACHESEIPQAGDYRTLNHTGIPLVIIRGEDRNVRTFINACAHRSAKIARDPSGNGKRFTCFFHLWSYDTQGNCVEITREEGYQEVGLCKEHCGLREVKTGVRLGMVFVNLDDECPTLDKYFGDAFESMEEVMGTKELEVFHYHRFIMRANWKQWHETNMELYHDWGHIVNRTTGAIAEDYHERRWKMYPNGHGMVSPFQARYNNYGGWKDRDKHMLPGLTAGEVRVIDLFPNTTLIARATAFRIDTSTPISPGQTLVEFRGLGIKDEPEEQRAMRVRHHNQFWGPFGRNLLEDVLFVEAVEESNRHGAAQYGIFARHERLRAQDDEVIRAYYRTWSELIGRPASDPVQTRD